MATKSEKPNYPRPAWDAEVVECKTQAQMEKALKAAKVAKLIAGSIALVCHSGDAPKVIVLPGASVSIETWGTSAPSIETWGTSAPSIETWGTSAPRIVTWETSAPSIVTRETSAPSIVTRETSAPRINDDTSSIPLIYLSGLQWRVTITDTQMSIGCQSHKLVDWWAFDDRRIANMDGKYALKFWRKHKVSLQEICAATGRPAAEVAKVEA